MAAAIAMSACAGPVETTANVLTASGTASLSAAGMTPENLFVAAYKRAYGFQLATYEGRADPKDTDQAYRNMASAGFGLVKTYCSDFFRKKGETQKWLNFSADAVAAAGALATGILAITGTSALAVSVVALSTTSAASSISLYEKDFLFGAENVDSVRLLTLNALSDNAAKAMEAPTVWDFQYTVNAILVNQELCKPASILRLTREAITAGSVRSTDSSGSPSADALFKELIGQSAGIQSGNIPLDSQVAALCWAATDGTADKMIVGQQVPNTQFPKGPASGTWDGSNRTTVANWCRRLSPTAYAQLQKQIENWRQTGTTTPTAAGEGTGSSQKVITTTVGK
jgi:hypothetical protein